MNEDKHARAERVFAEVLEELANTYGFKPEHVERVRQTPILFASEEIPKLEARLGEKGIPAEEVRGIGTLLHIYTNIEFCFVHGSKSIVVCLPGESADEERYESGIRGEAVHSFVHSVDGLRDGSGPYQGEGFEVSTVVDEFYETTLRLCEIDGSAAGIKEMMVSPIGLCRLALLYLQASPYVKDTRELADAVTSKILFLEMLKRGEEAPIWLAEHVYNDFDIFSTSLPQHVKAHALTWLVLQTMRPYTGTLSAEEELDTMIGITLKALYDSEVDLSCPKRYLATLEPWLAEYLAPKTS